MEDFIFKPKYNFVNVYVGIGVALIAGLFFLYLGIVGRSIASLIFGALFMFALISVMYIYPHQIVLPSHEIIISRLFLSDLIYSLYDIKKFRFLCARLEFNGGNFYFGSIEDHLILLNKILKRMQQLNIPINIDEEMQVNLPSILDSLEN